MISKQQRQQLLRQATKLNPVILIGNKGLTEAVHKEIDRALNDHELIKIKFHAKDHDYQQSLIAEICQNHQADLIQRVGHICIIYRENDIEDEH